MFPDVMYWLNWDGDNIFDISSFVASILVEQKKYIRISFFQGIVYGEYKGYLRV